jgi:hypothetical protein
MPIQEQSIIAKLEKGKIYYIFCETDGDIWNTGRRLLYYWNSKSNISELLNCGDLFQLNNSHGVEHTLSLHVKSPVYHFDSNIYKIRDLKESTESCSYKVYESSDDKEFIQYISKQHPRVKWIYLWKNNRLNYARIGKNSSFRKLNSDDSIKEYNSLEEDYNFSWISYEQKESDLNVQNEIETEKKDKSKKQVKKSSKSSKKTKKSTKKQKQNK